jgi:hypothetical protein
VRSWEEELTMKDVAADGGTASFDVKTMQFTIVLGPVLSHYVTLETKFERALYRGVMEGLGLLHPKFEVDE